MPTRPPGPPLSSTAAATLAQLQARRPFDASVTPEVEAALLEAATDPTTLEALVLARPNPPRASTGGGSPRFLRRFERRLPARGSDPTVANALVPPDPTRFAVGGVVAAEVAAHLRAAEACSKGAQAAVARARAEAVEGEKRRVRRALRATRRIVARAQATATRDAVELALALATRLLGESPAARAAWTTWLEATLRAADHGPGENAQSTPSGELRVYVHPDAHAEWSARLAGSALTVVADPRVEPADVWVSTPDGVLDLRRDTVLRGVLAAAT
jgi:hypothetical protein